MTSANVPRMDKEIVKYLAGVPEFRANVLSSIQSLGESMGETPRTISVPIPSGRGKKKVVVPEPVVESKPWIPPSPEAVVSAYLEALKDSRYTPLEIIGDTHGFEQWFISTIERIVEWAGIYGPAPSVEGRHSITFPKGAIAFEGTLVGDSVDNDVEALGTGGSDEDFIEKYLKESGGKINGYLHYKLDRVSGREWDTTWITYPINVQWDLNSLETVVALVPREEMLKAAANGLARARD